MLLIERQTNETLTRQQLIHQESNALNSSLPGIGNQKGMTLIEIMIVMAIIAGLLAVLGTGAISQFNKSKVENAKIQMRTIGQALEAFNLSCNSYPTTDQGLAALTKSPGESCPNWGPEPYMKTEPKDPWGKAYIYDSDGATFELKTLGRDRKDGGSGYDKDWTFSEIQN